MLSKKQVRSNFVGLRTVPVILKNGYKTVMVNALLDDASTQTYINSDVAAELGCQGKTEKVTVNVLNGKVETFETRPVAFEIRGLTGNVGMNVSAYTANKVTGNMKVVEWNRYKQQWAYLRDVPFPKTTTHPTVDILIGLDCVDLHYAIEERRGRVGEPIAPLTPLGWTCIGHPWSAHTSALQTNFAHTYFVKNLSGINRNNQKQGRFLDVEKEVARETQIVILVEQQVLKLVREPCTYKIEINPCEISWKNKDMQQTVNSKTALKSLGNKEMKKSETDAPNVKSFKTTMETDCSFTVDPHSSSSRLKERRVDTWINQYMENCQTPRIGIITSELRADEIKMEEIQLIKEMQRTDFKKEWIASSQRAPLASNSKLLGLQPFLDEDSLMRSDSRLTHAQFLSVDVRYPVILSRTSWVTKLIIREIHENSNHASGTNHTLATLSARNLIVSGREAIQEVEKESMGCRRRKDSDPLLNAFYRMTSRGEFPEEMYSDNATIFKESNSDLKALVEHIDEQRTAQSSANKGIKWHFNVTLVSMLASVLASYFGLVHECMIKSAKRAIRATMGDADINDEELMSAIAINSGLYQTLNPSADVPLTPNHFLHGQIGGQFAPCSTDETNFSLRKRWRRIQELVRHFWRRLLHEWVPGLNARRKWFQPERDIKVGEVVLVISPDTSTGSWPLSRILEVFRVKVDEYGWRKTKLNKTRQDRSQDCDR